MSFGYEGQVGLSRFHGDWVEWSGDCHLRIGLNVTLYEFYPLLITVWNSCAQVTRRIPADNTVNRTRYSAVNIHRVLQTGSPTAQCSISAVCRFGNVPFTYNFC